MMLEPKYTTYHSAVLDADPKTVWEEVGDFLQMLAIAFGDSLKSAHWLKVGSVSKVPATATTPRSGLPDMIDNEVNDL